MCASRQTLVVRGRKLSHAPLRKSVAIITGPKTSSSEEGVSAMKSLSVKAVVRWTLMLGCLCVMAAAQQTGGNWPQWRGPNRDGISKETGLLKAWPEGGPPLVWKATGAGRCYSSLAV